MSLKIRRAEYFNATVRDVPGEGFRILTSLAEAGVNLLAFNAIPVGPEHTQFALFPEDVDQLRSAAVAAGLTLTGPQAAILVQGDDELGSLASIHERLAGVGVSVFASSAVTDGRGGYGSILYLRTERMDEAASALGI